MKTTIERIFETLSKEKVELKSEKIELSLADDIRDIAKRGQQIQKDLKNNLNVYNGLLRAGGTMNKKLAEVEKIAKELGVKPPTEFKKLQEIADKYEEQGNAIKKVYNLF